MSLNQYGGAVFENLEAFEKVTFKAVRSVLLSGSAYTGLASRNPTMLVKRGKDDTQAALLTLTTTANANGTGLSISSNELTITINEADLTLEAGTYYYTIILPEEDGQDSRVLAFGKFFVENSTL